MWTDRHPVHCCLVATLDGFVNDLDAVFEAKFVLPWSFSEEAAAKKHIAQLQHNMWVTNARSPRCRSSPTGQMDRDDDHQRTRSVQFRAQFAGVFCESRSAFLDHERAKSELKALMPEDAKEASGHGVRAKRSKSGASALISSPGRTAMQTV
jgi:hypothetical protein